MTLATISEKTGLSVGLLLTLGVLGAGVVANFASARTDLGYVKTDIIELKSIQKELGARQAAMDVRMQRAEDNYARILESLGEVKSDLRSAIQRGVIRNASDRGR